MGCPKLCPGLVMASRLGGSRTKDRVSILTRSSMFGAQQPCDHNSENPLPQFPVRQKNDFYGILREGDQWLGKRRHRKPGEARANGGRAEETQSCEHQDEMQDRGTGYPRAGAPPCGIPRARVSGYVLMGHPPMRIMGRFFIWAILNMPGVRERQGGRGKQEREKGGAGKGEFTETVVDTVV